MLALSLVATGEIELAPEAAHAAEQALILARDSGSIATAVKAEHSLASVALLEGRAGDAVRILVDALDRCRELRSGIVHEPDLLVTLAQAQLLSDDPASARATSDQAVTAARQQGARVVESLAHAIRARIYRLTAAGPSDLMEASASVAAGEALATETGAHTYAAFLAEERARLDDDSSALKACAEGYDAIGATGHARRLRAELDSATSQEG